MKQLKDIRAIVNRIQNSNRSQHVKIKQALVGILDILETVVGRACENAKGPGQIIKPEPNLEPRTTYAVKGTKNEKMG